MDLFNRKISIVIPVYNVEKYICKCIDSVLSQTLKEFEIILVDDGSTDNSGTICDEYALKDNRIKIIHKNNGGVSDARNTGMDLAEGEFMLFVDSDDWIEHGTVEYLYNKIVENQSDIVVCSHCCDYTNNNYSIYKDLLDETFQSRQEIAEAIYKMDNISVFNMVWNKLYRTSIIKNNHLCFIVDGMPGEDLLFNCDYFKYVNKASFISQRLYHYVREDEDTLVSKHKIDLFSKVQIFSNARKSLYNYYNMINGKYSILYANTYVEYIFCCIPNIYRPNTSFQWSQRTKFLNEIFKSDEICKQMKLHTITSFHFKVFGILYKIGSGFIANFIYGILFLLRYKMSKAYRIFRKSIYLKQKRTRIKS